MVGPLAGAGQQLPISNTFQPGGNNQQASVRDRAEQEPVASQPNQVEAPQTPVVQTAESNTAGSEEQPLALQTAANETSNDSAPPRRGSVIDISA